MTPGYVLFSIGEIDVTSFTGSQTGSCTHNLAFSVCVDKPRKYTPSRFCEDRGEPKLSELEVSLNEKDSSFVGKHLCLWVYFALTPNTAHTKQSQRLTLSSKNTLVPLSFFFFFFYRYRNIF